mgnify:CR=1 FL=1
MLSPEAIAKIDYELTKYPADQRQAAVMSALRIVQAERGWLSKESVTEVAKYLGMPEIAAMEVATFYNMYDLSPVGKYKVTVCTNISCMLRGSDEIVNHLQKKLGVGFNEITPDGKFCLKEGECMGACGDSPVLLVNNKRMCSFMSKEKIDALLNELRAEGKAA